MRLSSHSTGLSALSAWMPTGSTISMKQRGSSKTGGRNTMRVVLTDLSEKGHQASSPGRSRRAGNRLNLTQPETNSQLGTKMLGHSTRRYTNIPLGTKDRSGHGDRTFNNLQTNFGGEIPGKEFFNSHA